MNKNKFIVGIIMISPLAAANANELVLPIGLSDKEVKKISKSWKCKLCPYDDDEATNWTVEPRVVAVSNDSFKHGDYTGLDKKGVNGVLDLKGQHRTEDAYYMELLVNDLGLDGSEVNVEGGKQGFFKISIDYSQIPKLNSDTSYTPFSGSSLTFPQADRAADTQSMNLGANQGQVNILTQRKHVDTQINIIQNSQLSYDLAFSRREKQGRSPLGVLVGPGSTSPVVVIPAFVDYSSDQWSAAVNYKAKTWQSRVDYRASQFRNGRDALYVSNPFTDAFLDQASVSTPPDNTWQQISALFATQVGTRTHASVYVANGSMEQDDDFLPYTVSAASDLGVTAQDLVLPANSLSGEIETFNANVNVVSQLTTMWRLNLRYLHEEQDNQTGRLNYSYVVADSAVTANPRANFPFGHRRQVTTLANNVALSDDHKLGITLKNAAYDRTYQEVSGTDEFSFLIDWRWQVNDQSKLRLYHERSDRNGSAYKAIAELTNPENTSLRKFNLADRERNKVGLSFNYFQDSDLNLLVGISTASDDYAQSDIGLQNSDEIAANLDVQYRVSDALQVNGFLSIANVDSEQFGEDGNGLWKAQATD